MPDFRWLMSSDVCKHCTHAACLDVCPTGALFRTEFGTVVVQDDVCNGCGYCVPACPFGVIERRPGDETVKNSGAAQKCTLCYDRIGHDQTPACAQACPTTSIRFGDLARDAVRGPRAGRPAARAGLSRGAALRRQRAATASAARARSSCCSTSPRSTACRRTHASPPQTCPPCSAPPVSPRWPCWPSRPARSWEAVADDHQPPRRRPASRAEPGRASGRARCRRSSPRRRHDGSRRRVRQLLRSLGRQAVALGGRHPGLHLPRRPRRGVGARWVRVVPHAASRCCDATAGMPRWRRWRSVASRWCATSASPPGRST